VLLKSFLQSSGSNGSTLRGQAEFLGAQLSPLCDRWLGATAESLPWVL